MGRNSTNSNSSKPETHACDPRQLPAALSPLLDMRNFVVWKWEPKSKGGGWTKVPYQPRKPDYKASATNPNNWGSYESACRAVEAGKADGIGFCLLDTNIAAFDIDACRDPRTGAIVDAVASKLVRRAKSYCEVTVSGTGLRIIGFGSDREMHTKQPVVGTGTSIESYRNCGRFITISGKSLDKTPKAFRDIDALIDTVVEELGGAPAATSASSVVVGEIKPVNERALNVLESTMPRELRKLVVNGVEEGDRSEDFFKAVKWMKDLKIRMPAIVGILKRYPDGIAEKYNDRLEKEVARAYGKPDTPKPDKPTKAEDVGTAEAKAKKTLIETSEEFTRTFSPPDYLLDGVCLKGFMYSMTAPTGHGKTSVLMKLAAAVALGVEFAGLEVSQGKVLYLAGENPDDVRMRWIAMAEHHGFDSDLIDVHFVAGSFDIGEMEKRITKEVDAIDGVVLVIIDTGPAFFMGDNENDNTDMLGHAKMMRRLVNLPGHPAVIAAMHPTKAAARDNLLPRGGGAFLAEVDGNLCAWRDDMVVSMHWQGKHRGVDFEPLMFELKPVTARKLIDSRGRKIPTVICNDLSKEQLRDRISEQRADQDDILVYLKERGAQSTSLFQIADFFDLRTKDGKLNKSRVQRLVNGLKESKLVEADRDGFTLTKKGKEVAAPMKAWWDEDGKKTS